MTLMLRTAAANHRRVRISVVIPARNAAETVIETLESVRAQTHSEWETIVVDDGSDDVTAEAVEAVSKLDSRIRLVSQPARGVSAARNAGIALASGEAFLFLDADDLIDPSHLALLGGALDAAPSLDAVSCGWCRLAPDGTRVAAALPWRAGDLFAALARLSPFPINACLVRADVVRAAGCFDEGLVTCEDWDLWQRIARRGARFGLVKDILAVYRMCAGSTMADVEQYLQDAMRTVMLGHSRDPRVADPIAEHADGEPIAQAAGAKLMLVAWAAGGPIGRGESALPTLKLVEHDRDPTLDPRHVAARLYESVPVSACRAPAAWIRLWPDVERDLREFLEALETKSGAPYLSGQALRFLEQQIVSTQPHQRPIVVGSTYAVDVEVTEPIMDAECPPSATVLSCRVTFAGTAVGTVELPVFAGRVRAAVLADAIAAGHAWSLLRLFFEQTVYRHLRVVEDGGQAIVLRGDLELGSGLPLDRDVLAAQVHDAVGWTILLQEVWSRPEWPAARFYDGAAEESAEERTATDAWLALDLAGDPPDVVPSGDRLDVVPTVAGVPLGVVSFPGPGRISASRIRANVTGALGIELARVVVREAVLGWPTTDNRSIRERLRSRPGDACEPIAGLDDLDTPPASRCAFAALPARGRGLVLARRRPQHFGTSASRLATLPPDALADLVDATAAAGETALRVDESDEVTYLPGLIVRSPTWPEPTRPGSATDTGVYDRSHFEALFQSTVDPWQYTSQYEREKYERTLSLVPEGIESALEVACAEGHFSVMLAPRVDRLLATDISDVALARARARGIDLENATFEQLDLVEDAFPGRFDLIVCSEVLYYVGGITELETVGRKLGDSLKPGGYLITAHANQVVDDPESPGFDWGLPFGAKRIGEVLAGLPELALEVELRSPLYRIDRLRRRRRGDVVRRRRSVEIVDLEQETVPETGTRVLWSGEASEPPPEAEPMTDRLPILMYHRVARHGGAQSQRYCVTPEAFEAQLAYLRDAGFRGASLEEWCDAIGRKQPIRGRAVLITFDDAYTDFLTDAWPLLRKYGFGATLFVVTDAVGQCNEWDASRGDPVPLLSWPELRMLRAEGVHIGSHTATHRALTALAAGDVVREATRSQAALRRQLGESVVTLAYPLGESDGVVRHLVGACGYDVGLTARPVLSRLQDDILALPRLEVRGTYGIGEFAQLLAGDVPESDPGPPEGLRPRREPHRAADEPQLAYEPDLIPPLELMRQEGVEVVEDWFAWANEWSMLLRIYGGLSSTSNVLEIGCGLGRIAFALRGILTPGGTYVGFEIVPEKIGFLHRTFQSAYTNFQFTWADVHNTYYNPKGRTRASEYRFPYDDATFDVVYAASVFTHTLPEVAARYFRESARVLRPGGRCVFSFFLLDNYEPGRTRPSGFAHPRFDIDHEYGGWGAEFAVANTSNPEEMTGFRVRLLERLGNDAGLVLERTLPGLWSGSYDAWVATQDVVILAKPA